MRHAPSINWQNQPPLSPEWPILDAIFFDFDGVLVDSIGIKARGYRTLFSQFGDSAADYAADYHRRFGGVDRYRKIASILEACSISGASVEALAKDFGRSVVAEVIAAPLLEPASTWLAEASRRQKRCFLVSATPETELKYILEERRMLELFTEYRGSPILKTDHLAELIARHGLNPAGCVFVGDACSDFEAARENRVLFIGVSSGELS